MSAWINACMGVCGVLGVWMCGGARVCVCESVVVWMRGEYRRMWVSVRVSGSDRLLRSQ